MNRIIEEIIVNVLIPLIIVGVGMLIGVGIVGLLALCGVNINE